MFCTPCFAVFPTHFSQLDLNPANLEATVEAEWILAFFNDVTITSSLGSVVKVLMGYFTIFQSRGFSGWFIPKIMKICLQFCQSYGQNTVGPFFRTRCIYTVPTNKASEFTGRPARSADMPVLFLLSGPKMGFSPRRGDTLPRWTWNLARLPMANFTFIGAKMWEHSPKNCQNFEFWP